LQEFFYWGYQPQNKPNSSCCVTLQAFCVFTSTHLEGIAGWVTGSTKTQKGFPLHPASLSAIK